MNYPFKKPATIAEDYASTSPSRVPQNKSRWGWKVSLVILIFSALWWGWLKITNPETFPIRTVSIIGNYSHVDHTNLQQVVSPFLANGMLNIDLNALKNNLLRIPWVATVNVQRNWPDKLAISLTEQTPIAHWNQTELLNNQGDIFNPGTHPATNNLPWLNGPPNQQDALWTAYQQINQQLAPLGLTAVWVEMAEPQTWQIELNNGLRLILGHENGLERLQRFVSVYQKIFATHTNDVEYIDLRYANGLAVKWKSNPNGTIQQPITKKTTQENTR